ncbi:ComE operon protein 1 [Meiothermus luteus]|uniref:ComE operon protein 1 n=1 Tax=Meiothermus luteus TaxID=2026184 RepID=A0A399EKU4_9DEIN|nr:ComEA family DNA-binding protein [Meiothermus luteus]RIH85227.1 ComE operon protein 1 [Meiothermus luteus]RMH57978.1 MAG: ComEA family DNA-binding protein [Deinococcota bacterium]
MERWLNLAYVGAVLLLGLVSLWPRLTTQFAPVQTSLPGNPSSETPAVLQPGPARPPVARVSLNTASQAEIESLPGVGPTLARRIIENRPYRSVEELERVKGIGPKLLERLKPLVVP